MTTVSSVRTAGAANGCSVVYKCEIPMVECWRRRVVGCRPELLRSPLRLRTYRGTVVPRGIQCVVFQLTV